MSQLGGRRSRSLQPRTRVILVESQREGIARGGGGHQDDIGRKLKWGDDGDIPGRILPVLTALHQDVAGSLLHPVLLGSQKVPLLPDRGEASLARGLEQNVAKRIVTPDAF